MKTVRIAYVDYWSDLDPDNFIFTRVLQKRYNVIIDNENPEYVFCSHFGNNFLNYDAVRILFLGEAKTPDFNVYDYAMGFDNITFGDRYLQYPLFLLYETWELALNKHHIAIEEIINKNKFCNTVVSNGNGARVRDKYFDDLSRYEKVDSGGRYRNNLPGGKPVKDKLAFQKQYKYSLAFENSSFPGYVTEKIVDAWAAGTVPIYWGAPDVNDFFNPKAFIDCTKMESTDELIDTLKGIDDEKYISMMREPILTPNSIVLDMIKENYLATFLYNIFDQDMQSVKRRNSSFTMWGMNYENHIKKWKRLEDNKWLQKLRKIIRK